MKWTAHRIQGSGQCEALLRLDHLGWHRASGRPEAIRRSRLALIGPTTASGARIQGGASSVKRLSAFPSQPTSLVLGNDENISMKRFRLVPPMRTAAVSTDRSDVVQALSVVLLRIATQMGQWYIVRRNPSVRSGRDIRAEDLAGARGYYCAHRDEIDNEIKENEGRMSIMARLHANENLPLPVCPFS